MADKKKVNVVIDGRNFTVVGDGPEEYVKMIASYVDKKISEMQNKNDRLSSSMLATLAAINITDEMYKYGQELESLKNKAKAPMENYGSTISELNSEKAKNEELNETCNSYKDEIINLRRENDQLSKDINNNEKAFEMKEKELKESQVLIKKLQDKVYNNQVELVELKKELDEVLKTYNTEKNLFSNKDV